MTKEYELIRSEMIETIKKQDNLENIIFTILGLSSAVTSTFKSWFGEDNLYGNVILILFALLISDILLARIIQSRNTVYYLSTYLYHLERKENDVSWEKNLNKFKNNGGYGLPLRFNIINIINWISFHISLAVLKNAGYFALSTVMFYNLLRLMKVAGMNKIYWKSILVYIFGIFLYMLSAIFTFTILFDQKMRKDYQKRWSEILDKKTKVKVKVSVRVKRKQ